MMLRAVALVCLALAGSLAGVAQDTPSFSALERWRADHEAALRADGRSL